MSQVHLLTMMTLLTTLILKMKQLKQKIGECFSSSKGIGCNTRKSESFRLILFFIREENLLKISRRVKEYKVEILNPPREGKKLLVLDVDYTLFGKSAETVLHRLLPVTAFSPFVFSLHYELLESISFYFKSKSFIVSKKKKSYVIPKSRDLFLCVNFLDIYMYILFMFT